MIKETELIKQVYEKEGILSFTLYQPEQAMKNKKHKEHNSSMINLLSILDDTDFGIEVTESNDITFTLEISKEAVKYIHDQLTN